MSENIHPKELKSWNNGLGVKKQLARIARREERKKNRAKSKTN